MSTELDLTKYGIKGTKTISHNPTYQELYEDETNPQLEGYERGIDTTTGAVCVKTGVFTGRSPKDKYTVLDSTTSKDFWFDGKINQSITTETFDELHRLAAQQLSNKDKLYVVDAYCGTNSDTRLKVRFVMEVAWQAHFVTNMFIRPSLYDIEHFGEPDFVVLNASKCTNANWKEMGLNSENFVAFDLTKRMQVIGGTWYGGEMKKGLFSVMNYYMPLHGIASMHCSANVGSQGDVAIFFGLSGTGKTTLSADPKRYLIGDDEHGWDDHGVFNYEGGCYAKTINLSKENEPDIWRAIKRDALLENVTIMEDGTPDYSDASVTENTRVSYPIYNINKIVLPSRAGHAKEIIYLSADAYGVLPPVSILDEKSAQYHFLCGYTSKLAGTERGITEPTPSFSPAFGEAFLTLHPTVYAGVLAKKMKQHQAKAYLVNTGWNGTGKRISIKDTRAIIDAIIDGSINKVERRHIPILNLEIPVSLNGVSDILDPRTTYTDLKEWERKANALAHKYIDNFEQYLPEAEHLRASGPMPSDSGDSKK